MRPSLEQNDRDVKEVDYLLREEVSKIKGQIDLLYYGVLDDLDDDESQVFLGKFKNHADALYSLLDSNIIARLRNKVALLYQEIDETQKEVIYKLAEVAEARSKETGHHVKRVSEYCNVLARAYGLSKEETETITFASAMHDIGKLMGTSKNRFSQREKRFFSCFFARKGTLNKSY